MRQRMCRRPRPVEPRSRGKVDEEGESRPEEALTLGSRFASRKVTLARPRPPGPPPISAVNVSLPSTLTSAMVDNSIVVHTGSGPKALGGAEMCVSSTGRSGDSLRSTGVGGTAASGKSSRSGRANGLVAKDPLLHTGRWVFPEYDLLKPVPWTGYWTCCGNKSDFTTHCLDFDARIKQRQADYQRNTVDHLARVRRLAASKFRATWESQEVIVPSFSDEGISTTKIALVGHSPRTEECPPNPFRRQKPKWLDRLVEAGEASVGSPVARAEGSSSIFGESSGSKVERLVVRRDHVRSVVNLAMSEARVNAFVVISALEGLVSVATGRMGERAPTARAAGMSSNTGDSVREDSVSLERTSIKRSSVGASSQEKAIDPYSSVQGSELASFESILNCSKDDCSGAALCVDLGALPAVIGCLNEHAGHLEIETLGLRLLRIFATDSATRKVISGNGDVTAVCVERMAPSYLSGGDVSLADSGQRCCGSYTEKPRQECAKSGRPTHTISVCNASPLGTGFDCKIDAGDPCTDIVSADQTRGAVAAPPCPSAASFPAQLPTSTLTQSPSARGVPEEQRGCTNTDDDRTIRLAVDLKIGGDDAVPRSTSTRDTGYKRRIGSDGTSVGAATSGGEGVLAKTTPIFVPPPVDVIAVLSAALEGSPDCQNVVLKQGGIEAMLTTVHQARTDAIDDVLRTETCIRILELLGTRKQGRQRLVEEGCVNKAFSAIKRFGSHHGVLAAAMALLLLLSDTSVARNQILKAGGVRVIFEAMKSLVGNAEVQVKGTDVLQTLVNEEPQARLELDAIKGGWQWLCQGTSGGNELIRYAPGEQHIHGWTVSEEERLSTEGALATAELLASKWTPYSLAAFMGTIRKHRGFQAGNLAFYNYFQVVKEAGLLPHAHEDVQEWRDRMTRYEEERHIQVNSITRRRLARDRTGIHARSISSASSSLVAI